MKKLLLLCVLAFTTLLGQTQNIENQWAYFANDGNYVSQPFYLPTGMSKTSFSIVKKNDPIAFAEPIDAGNDTRTAMQAYFTTHRKRATVFIENGSIGVGVMLDVLMYEEMFFAMVDETFNEDASVPRDFNINTLEELLTGDYKGVKAKEMEKYIKSKNEIVSFMGDKNAYYRERILKFGDTPAGDRFHIPIDFALKTYAYYDAKADKSVAVVFYSVCIDKVKLANPSKGAFAVAAIVSFFNALGNTSNYFEVQKKMQRDDCSQLIDPFIERFKFKTPNQITASSDGPGGTSGTGGSGSGSGVGTGVGGSGTGSGSGTGVGVGTGGTGTGGGVGTGTGGSGGVGAGDGDSLRKKIINDPKLKKKVREIFMGSPLTPEKPKDPTTIGDPEPEYIYEYIRGGRGGGRIPINIVPVRDSTQVPPLDDLTDDRFTSGKVDPKRYYFELNGAISDIAESKSYIYSLGGGKILRADKKSGAINFVEGPIDWAITTIAALGDDDLIGWKVGSGLIRYPSGEVVWKAADPKADYNVHYDAKREQIVLNPSQKVGGSNWVILLDKKFEELISYQGNHIRSSLTLSNGDLLIASTGQLNLYRGEDIVKSWTISCGTIIDMVENSKGNIFGITEKALYKFDIEKQTTTELARYDKPLDKTGREVDKVRAMVVDKDDNLIVGCTTRTCVSIPPAYAGEPRELTFSYTIPGGKTVNLPISYASKLHIDEMGNLIVGGARFMIFNEKGIAGYGINFGSHSMITTLIPAI